MVSNTIAQGLVGSSPTPGHRQAILSAVPRDWVMPYIRPQSTVDRRPGVLPTRGCRTRENAALHGVAVKRSAMASSLSRAACPEAGTHVAATVHAAACCRLEPSAYAALLGCYLGDGYISLGRRDVYSLHISYDRSYPGIIADVARPDESGSSRSEPHTRSNAPGWSSYRTRGALAVPVPAARSGTQARALDGAGGRGRARSSRSIRRHSCAGCSTPTVVGPGNWASRPWPGR